MSLLAALARAYDRLPDAPPYGYSSEKIGFCVVLNPDGSVAAVEDLRDMGKKRSPRLLTVPAAPKRSGSTPRPNFLWDNANYALGIGKLTDPTDTRHDAFRDKHLEYLDTADSPDLLAFLQFLRNWRPEQVLDYFDPEKPPTEGVIFGLAAIYREHFLHESNEAKGVWAADRDRWIAVPGKSTARSICLVTGKLSAIQRTHPPIKGVWGGKTEMALVSFNSESYESYGHEQGDNAPVSEAAAFQYTTTLNRFLDRDSGHRLQIGDTSTVFWADASGLVSEMAESLFAAFIESPATGQADDRTGTDIVAAHLERIRRGDRLAEIEPKLAEGVRFHVLGLAPNAARLSVRFYWEDDFGQLTRNYQKYLRDTQIEPPPRDGWPPLWRYLVELAVLNKRENIPPNLAGEWMRAILTGAPYPMTLLATTLMRIRADGEVTALRAAILKSVLIRNFKKENTPVALDPSYDQSKGYLLGRLFAAYEEVQRAALGSNVNATIKDKFYGAASASPQKVFATLTAGAENHFTKLRKTRPGRAFNLKELVMSIMDQMSPGNDPIPAFLSASEQGMFGLGYYHQRSDFFRKHDEKADDKEPETNA